MIEKIQIVHNDFRESFEEIPLESVGRLMLALMAFANDEDYSEIIGDDAQVRALFPTVKAHIVRQEEFRLGRANNGSKGGAPKGNQNAKKTTKNNLNQPKTTKNKQKQAPIPIPNPIPNPYIKDIVEIISTLNTEAGTHYGESKETVRLITARLRDGFTVADFKKVISKKVKEWKGTEQAIYIRPSTLFAPSHFEEYLNAPEKKEYTTKSMTNRSDSDIDYDKIYARCIKN